MAKLRLKLVVAMIVAALAVGMLVFYFSGSWRVSIAIAGIALLIDLTFVPKCLPHIFKTNPSNDEEENE